MKKAFLVAGFAIAVITTASAQTKKAPPPPPKPPVPPTEIKVAPPPPPPAPGEPPAPPPPPPAITDADIADLPKDYQDFLTRNPSVSSVHWTESTIVIVLKKGKTEKYALNEKGIEQAETKYGKLPMAPPPPPKPPKPPVVHED